MIYFPLETIFSREIVLYAQKLPDRSALYVQNIPGWFPLDPVPLDGPLQGSVGNSHLLRETRRSTSDHRAFSGNLNATGQDALNTWHDRYDTTFSADLKELKQLLWRLGEWFTDMDAIVGNHDLRVAKATQGQITIDMLIEDTGVQLGQYSYLYLWNPTTKEWTYVCHQFNYSKTSVKREQSWRPRIEV